MASSGISPASSPLDGSKDLAPSIPEVSEDFAASNGSTTSNISHGLDGSEDIALSSSSGSTIKRTNHAREGSLGTNHALSNLNPNSIKNSTPAASVKICVFCGASPGKSPAHMQAAKELAKVMAEHKIQLVYGGGTVGLMGEIARELVKLSGPESVHGIIPAPLVKYERGPDSDAIATHAIKDLLPEYTEYGKTTVVKDMHTRKQLMAKEITTGAPGSGFIALSGGYGTLEELMEMVTWHQLGIHNRGVVALNIEGYWDGLLEWVRKSVDTGFVGEGNKEIIKEARTGEEAVLALKTYKVAEGRFKLEWGNE